MISFSGEDCAQFNQTIGTSHQFSNALTTYGSMFTVRTNIHQIVVTSLDIFVQTFNPIIFEVFTKFGPYHGYESKREAWSKIASGKIIGEGPSRVTNIPRDSFNSVSIPKNSMQSFYVSINIPELINDDGTKGNVTKIQNNFIEISEGLKIHSLPFCGDKNQLIPTSWQGSISFQLVAPCEHIDDSKYSSPTNVPEQITIQSQSKVTNRFSTPDYHTEQSTPIMSPLINDPMANDGVFIQHDMMNFETTEIVLNLAIDHEKSYKKKFILNEMGAHMQLRLETFLKSETSPFYDNVDDIPYILHPIICRYRYDLTNSGTCM